MTLLQIHKIAPISFIDGIKSVIGITLFIFVILFSTHNKVYAQQQIVPEYFTRYEHIKMTRTTDGILEVRFHTNGGPIVFTGRDHTTFVEAFFLISQDRDNKLVIITGSGNEWFAQINLKTLGDMSNPRIWDPILWEGQKTLMNLLDIPVPVIFAINGPATVHAEYVLTADFILATENAYFQDSHLRFAGIVPGDGMHIVWPRYTQEKLFAREAHKLGVVSEVLPNKRAFMKRSYELARQILKIPELPPALYENAVHPTIKKRHVGSCLWFGTRRNFSN